MEKGSRQEKDKKEVQHRGNKKKGSRNKVETHNEQIGPGVAENDERPGNEHTWTPNDGQGGRTTRTG